MGPQNTVANNVSRWSLEMPSPTRALGYCVLTLLYLSLSLPAPCRQPPVFVRDSDRYCGTGREKESPGDTVVAPRGGDRGHQVTSIWR